MSVVFWLSLAAIGFTYAGYPVLMAALARWRPLPLHWQAQTPAMDVVLVVHGGADALAAKLENLLALDYPADALTIHVFCDGCPASAAVAQRHASARIKVTVFPQRRGKSACLGDALPTLSAPLVMFNDVRQRTDAGAAKALAAALADPTVGAASGELVLQADSGFGQGVDAYWRYEKFIRRMESRSGSIVGVTGAIYAARRELIPTVPAGLILDDMWIPLAIAQRGARVVFVSDALAFDRASADAAAEQRRKRRTLAGNFQLIHRQPALAIPGAHPLAWRLWGHKWSRLLAPWLLLLALLGNLWLAIAGSAFYQALLALQLVAYLAAWLGLRRPALASRHAAVRLASAFVSLNASAMWALLDYLRNPQGFLWQTTPIKDVPSRDMPQ
ncbi:glycosyltransferase family 2 protein [Pseudoxanthomonas dokdonensis]|uniref:Glycosyltransferase 2-like domain-containing protein n=1 Tax=Pseudoxanthomonas dokdonensis TaxID=344882 RepID=A0A0R0CID0_9GAMM|nr:glycosyltransferase family 2 protein [Pseudoxanthomonas dokdonensis]KRG68950.1 hypothetical protein ABB29_10845 [Pseudoxanthomonas dokdonensis]